MYDIIRHLIPSNKLWGEQGCTFVCSSLNNETKRNSSGMNIKNVLIIHREPSVKSNFWNKGSNELKLAVQREFDSWNNIQL